MSNKCWNCVRCGLRNKHKSDQCLACSTNKPIQTQNDKASLSASSILNTLHSNGNINQVFAKQIKHLIQATPQHIMEAFLNDINRSIINKYLIPTVIVSLCVNYFSENIYPLLIDEECNNDRGLIVRTLQSDEDIIGIATNKSKYYHREKLICNKLNGFIVLDLVDDIEIKWKQILCINDGNIFIRCNNLKLEDSVIRTTQYYTRKHTDAYSDSFRRQKHPYYTQTPLGSRYLERKRKRRKGMKDEYMDGNVILIVKNELFIDNVSIFTGCLYIECGKLSIEGQYMHCSHLFSSKKESVVTVNGKRFKPPSNAKHIKLK